MLQTYEAVLEPNGHLYFTETVPALLSEPCRVLVTFTEPASTAAHVPEDWRHLVGSLKDSSNFNVDRDSARCGGGLSESALAEDWARTEEDAAWAHLRAAR